MTAHKEAVNFVISLDRSALGIRAVDIDVLVAVEIYIIKLRKFLEYERLYSGSRRRSTSRSTRAVRKRRNHDNNMQALNLDRLNEKANKAYLYFFDLAYARGVNFLQVKDEIFMWHLRIDPDFVVMSERWNVNESERLCKMVDNPDLYQYFIAGIWDVKIARNFANAGIDPHVASLAFCS